MTLQEIHQLIVQLVRSNRLGEAENLCRQVLAQKPDEAATGDLLGSVLIHAAISAISRGEISVAENKLIEAAKLRPNDPAVHNNLGGLRISQQRSVEAIAPLRRALQLQPDYGDALSNLGLAYLETSQPEESIATYARAVKAAEALSPGDAAQSAMAHFMLGNALRVFGKLEQAIAEYRKSIEINSDFSETWTALLYAMNLSEGFSGEGIFEEHRRYDAKFSLNREGPACGPATRGRIRVGFVSADFKEHAIIRFFPAVFGLDRKQFEIYCYANVSQPDEVTERLKKQSDVWRNIFGMSDSAAAGLIRKDQIDVLIDLSGHTTSNRLRVFTHRPAPLQMSWLGYPNTTGLSCIDYRVTDSWADPPGMTEHLHSEKLWRLDPCFLCYQPMENSPEVSEAPVAMGGPITFGSFNDFAKIRPVTIALWAGAMRAVPDSRLVLKTRQLSSQWAQDQIIAAFEREGIAADRLTLLGRDASPRAHLEKYSLIDIALDTYPYHGTTTSCDALWMGVPVVSLAGKTHVSRVAVSLLHAVGLEELAVDSREEFVRATKALAGDLSRLRQIRSSLREWMKGSALGDSKAFAERFSAMLTETIDAVKRK